VVPSQALGAFSPLLTLNHFWHSANAIDVERVHRQPMVETMSECLKLNLRKFY